MKGMGNSLLKDKIRRAEEILKQYEPSDGYILAFSGGKDSIVIRHLAERFKIKYTPQYANTTIDPPELIKFIREYHSDVAWINSKYKNMMRRVAYRPGLPPTRLARWCCHEFKEYMSPGRITIIGVRAEESPSRKKNWSFYSRHTKTNQERLCPIFDWTTADIWEYIERFKIPYCKLYDEGWNRLGCVGCPLAGPYQQSLEFQRWPRYARNWLNAVRRNYEHHFHKLRRDGKRYKQASFPTFKEFWIWWRWQGKKIR